MKNCLILFLFLMLALPVMAKNNNDKVLYCSYISGGTDIYFTLEPITIKNNGSLIMKDKVIGKIVNADKENGELFAVLGGGSTWSLETKRMLSIYTKNIEGEAIYNFGSCVAK